jgi:excisionase family DNA binding protein
MPEVLTTQQAAEFLSVSIETIRSWTSAGIIPASRIRGPVRRYIKEDVIAALRSRQTQGVAK